MKVTVSRGQEAIAGRPLAIVTMTLLLVAGVVAQDMSAHHHMDTNASVNGEAEIVQDWAKERLAKSPRHRE